MVLVNFYYFRKLQLLLRQLEPLLLIRGRVATLLRVLQGELEHGLRFIEVVEAWNIVLRRIFNANDLCHFFDGFDGAFEKLLVHWWQTRAILPLGAILLRGGPNRRSLLLLFHILLILFLLYFVRSVKGVVGRLYVFDRGHAGDLWQA